MVTPNNYPPLEGRRYGSRVGAYPPSYPERRAVAYPMYPEMRNSALSEDDASSQRKRIAVAVSVLMSTIVLRLALARYCARVVRMAGPFFGRARPLFCCAVLLGLNVFC